MYVPHEYSGTESRGQEARSLCNTKQIRENNELKKESGQEVRTYILGSKRMERRFVVYLFAIGNRMNRRFVPGTYHRKRMDRRYVGWGSLSKGSKSNINRRKRGSRGYLLLSIKKPSSKNLRVEIELVGKSAPVLSETTRGQGMM